MRKMYEIKKSDTFELAHKCTCGALFTSDKDSMFVEPREDNSCDLLVNMMCPWCNKKIEIHAIQLPKEILKELIDKYYDNRLTKRLEK